MHDVVFLDVSPLPRVVRDGVFDAYGWCASDVLEWRRPQRVDNASLDRGKPIAGDNPPGLVFVLREPVLHRFLPRELARMHAIGYGLGEEEALAPWAIDDATDLLYAHRVPPREAFWLAAPAVDTLVWGLHDWAHFHNHGPFDEPAMTELQCDLLALAWLRRNARVAGLDAAALESVARDLATLSRKRFDEERISVPNVDFEALFLAEYPTSRVL